MKLFSLVTLSIVLGFFIFSNAYASDKSDCIYGSKIDQIISFYQGRLYLFDSQYTILSDIGKDAMKKIKYLQEKKGQLVKEMNDREVEFKAEKIRAYVLNKSRLEVSAL